MLQHILQRCYNRLLAVTVGALNNADRRGRIAVAKQNTTRFLNLPRPFAAARIIKGNYKIRRTRRINTRRSG
jgi:hypothetical protein